MPRIVLLLLLIAVFIAGGLLLAVAGGLQDDINAAPPAVTIVSVPDEEPAASDGNDADKAKEKEQEKQADASPVLFSHKDTFYSQGITVTLSQPEEKAGGSIYYSLDGKDPTTAAKKYTAPIVITATGEVKATTIKAAVITNGKSSDVVTKSYVTGTGVKTRFDENTLIFVLSTDPYNLYDYDYGIAVEGALRDEYLREAKPVGEIKPTDPANYNMRGREAERPMYVEVYDSTGKQVISQLAGVKVVGGYSRSNEHKSFRLIARKEYSPDTGKFKYAFFPGAADSFGEPLKSYDRLTLRNNANDREFAAVRDELSQQLAAEAGFPDTQSARPAAIFLNGEYYGFSWLKQAYHESYLEDRYGGEEDNYRIVANIEKAYECDDHEALKQYLTLYELADSAVRAAALSPQNSGYMFTNDAIFDKFAAGIDIENLLLYCAIQTYIDNKDWPGNNYKAWRYIAGKDEDASKLSPYNDGKWRFLMFDVEYAWSLYGNNGKAYRDDTLADILSGKHQAGKSVFMSALFQRKDMRERFANIMCDLMDGVFAPAHVRATLDNLIDISKTEYDYALDKGTVSQWTNVWSAAESRDQIREFADMREAVMRASLRKNFELSDNIGEYTVLLKNVPGVSSRLSTQVAKEDKTTLTGTYFDCYSVSVSAEAYTGYKFTGWNVNGKTLTESVLTLTADMAEAGQINVKPVVEKQIGDQTLFVSEVSTSSKADFVEIFNPNSVAISTKGMSLSDDEKNPGKWRLPTVTIAAGETLVITTKNNNTTDALRRPQMSFNLKNGETLLFTDAEGGVLSKVLVAKTKDGTSLQRTSSGKYAEKTITEGTHTA